ncbi:hypothetical protein ARTSIC4J27_84 [Pseudarthrobacter siccitolerans]|uniref:Uncharacterized protein n=1 Tax=Pseudarthrobacter siccitolerans TaxID=861266 RepID=A0A024GXF3_9MICC|nr:hypothetical protein ARTSIC4J27_84 [Pseudarthrobacter siccitolerans]
MQHSSDIFASSEFHQEGEISNVTLYHHNIVNDIRDIGPVDFEVQHDYPMA